MAFMAMVVVALPPAPDWTGQAAYEQVFGQVPRIVFASILAFWAGEFANSLVLAKMKIWTQGRHLWSRTIGSTVVGQGVDSLIFYPLAFWGAAGWTNDLVVKVLLTQWVLKVELGGASDARHICGGRHLETARGRGRLRRADGFQPVPCEDLTFVSIDTGARRTLQPIE